MGTVAGKNEHIYAVIRRIENDLMCDWDTELLSRLGYISRTQLYRDFYSVTGHSVKEYVRKRRLSNALALIKTSELPLSEISYGCGYSSQQMLCRVVKRTVNMTPLEYKDSHVYYFFPPFNGGMGNQIMVSNETIPKALCIKYCQPGLKGIENNAVDLLLSLIPRFAGRVFGRNGGQDGVKFCYELYLTEADGLSETLRFNGFSISHQREAFTATFASTTVKNIEESINSAWDYLYTDWLCNSMFEYSGEHYFEEYLVKNDEIAKLRLFLPIRKRNDYMRISLEQMAPMHFIVSKAKGNKAEQISSETVIDYLSKHYPYVVKTSKVFYMQKGANVCTCGVKVNSGLRIVDGKNIRNFCSYEGLHAVLHTGVMGDYGHYRELLLSWVQNNGLIADMDNVFAVYDASSSYDNPEMRLYCPVKMVRNDNTCLSRYGKLRPSKYRGV